MLLEQSKLKSNGIHYILKVVNITKILKVNNTLHNSSHTFTREPFFFSVSSLHQYTLHTETKQDIT